MYTSLDILSIFVCRSILNHIISLLDEIIIDRYLTIFYFSGGTETEQYTKTCFSSNFVLKLFTKMFAPIANKLFQWFGFFGALNP